MQKPSGVDTGFSLAWLLEPLSVETFLDEIWGGDHYHIKRGCPGYFNGLLPGPSTVDELLELFRREPSAVAEYAGRALGICEEHHIAQHHPLAICENGWALGVTGESEKGLAQITEGLDRYSGVAQHLLLALQADVQLAAGKPEAALASVAAGLKAVEKMGEHRWQRSSIG